MHVVFRADASATIGTGHVHRCVALAIALEQHGARTTFITRDLGLDTSWLVGQRPHLILPAPTAAPPANSAVAHAAWAEVDQATDASQCLDLLAASPDWVVVDHYAFDADWHDAVRLGAGARIVAIDDLADRLLAVDLIVDHNFAADYTAKYAQVAPGTPLLGGPRYALLQPAFADAPRYEPVDQLRSIGVFMGGIDSVGATTLVLDAITGIDAEIGVVTTSANPHLPALQARKDITLEVDQPNLAAFFARHDLQVGAGGGATWERCCIGAPTLLLAVAANQQASVPGLAAIGAVETCVFQGAAIGAAVSALAADPLRRRNLAENARSLVDGLGAKRVALRMLRDTLTMRPAGIDDAAQMFAWRNHPATRGVSRDPAPIAWLAHLDWLARVIADKRRALLIAQVGNLPVGVIRFDRIGDAACEVSLYLDPALHGLGLGQRMLLAGEVHVSGLDIHAEVMDGNAGSANMFASAGYATNGPNHWIKPAKAGGNGRRSDKDR